MTLTEHAPTIPLSQFKRTKIVATLGPATNNYEQILALIQAGANVLRLNFSHGTYEQFAQWIKWIRQASREYDKPVAIIQDLQGPKVRVGDFEGVIEIAAGDELTFQYKADYATSGHIPTQYDLTKKVKVGERLYLWDGKIHTVITAVDGGIVRARADNGGQLLKRKAINLPDTDFGGDIITAKDRADLQFGVETGEIDYVALTFVQTANDLVNLRHILHKLGSDAKVMPKIETKAAIDNLESIVQESDAVMIARGDLAVETPAETVPVVQRQIIGLGQRYGKPTIVATQMLLSMVTMPEPTRAEVSDVATAVFVGADAVMLSDETAIGQNPIDAVKTMKRVICYTELNTPLKVSWPEYEDHSRQGSIARAVVRLAESIQAKAIIAETRSGATARSVASRRADLPIIAVTDSVRTAQQLALVYAVKSYVRPAELLAAAKLTDWMGHNHVLAKGDIAVAASGSKPGVVGTTDTIKVLVVE